MEHARRLVTERIVTTSILLSTIAMIATGFTTPGSHAYYAWLALDVACVTYFAIEAGLKMRIHGWDGYWADPWNRFDLVIVVLSLPVLAAPFTDETAAFVGVPVVRMARLFRLFRLLRFIPERARLGAGIVRALRASVGVFLAIALVNFIFAMGAYELFAHKAPALFGDPARASYSMFRIFTIEGWHEIPEAIAAATSAGWALFARIYFGIAVLLGGILGLSLGNAVFVDQMIADNNDVVEHDVEALTREIQGLRAEISELRSLLVARPPVSDRPAG